MPHNLGNLFDHLSGGGEVRSPGVERMLRQLAPRPPGQQGPTADAEGVSGAHRRALDRRPEVTTGRITDAVAYTHMYKVQLDHGGPILACSDLTHTSTGVLGARQVNTYAPGTGVIVLLLHQVEYGLILGAHPEHGVDAFAAMSDMIGQGSDVGLNVDDVHRFPFQLGSRGGIADWSCGRPFDSLPVGEWGATTETGLMIFLDPFMAMMRVDEETGLWVFYHDQLSRLAGHNLQVRSAGHELEALDDQGEFGHYEGWAPHLYEARGVLDGADDPFRDVSVMDSQQNTPWLSTVEPLHEDQQGFYRREDFQGYLGQGGRRQLAAPGPDAPAVQTYSHETDHVGLAEEGWSLDGLVALRSAKGILLSKRAVIPRPKRIRRPEAAAGDSVDDYRFGGLGSGAGSPHVVEDWPDGDPGDRGLIQASALADVLARAFNWQGLHPFAYHAKDWYTPEESDHPWAEEMAAPLPFAALATQQLMPLPTPVKITVDPRYGQVAYYPNDSCVGLLDDGGVVITGGCGEELLMAHGSIYLRAPGDIWRLPGKSDIVWAGWDAIVKANNAVDISANWDDVRIKAEKNVLVLGGNNGCGGVLVESKGVGTAYAEQEDDNLFTGVVIRAKGSPVVVTTDVLFAVLPAGAESTEVRLNAGGGLIATESAYFYRRLDAAIDDFGTTANEFWADTAQVGTPLAVAGDLAASGSVAQSVAGVTTRQGEIMTAITGSGLRERMTHLEDSTDVVKMEFFFRPPSAMMSAGLLLHEARWQRLARAASAGVGWEDNPVTGAFGRVSRAHPGRETWEDEDGYVRQDFVFYDPLTGLDADRSGGGYEQPQWPTPDPSPFTAFLIIVNPPGV